MRKHHRIETVDFAGRKLIVRIDGKEYTFTLRNVSTRLADASRAEREKYEISPSGYGIHWPLIDEDLSIDGLLGVKHQRLNKRHSILA